MKHFLAFILFAIPFISSAQSLPPVSHHGGDNFLGMGFRTGYEALSVNPANITGLGGKNTELGILNFNVLFHTDGLTNADLRNAFKGNDPLDVEVRNLLVDAVSGQEGVTADLDLDWLYASFKLGNFGSFSAGITEELNSNFLLNDTLANILAFGSDSSQYFTDPVNLIFSTNSIEGSSILYSHIRSLNIGYSRKLTNLGTEEDPIDLFAGVGYRRLWGVGYFTVGAENGALGGNSAFSELYEIDFNYFDFITNGEKQLFDNTGTGSAWSFGGNINFNNTLTVGASVIDLGSINWEGEVFAPLNPSQLHLDSLTNGLNDLNINDQIDELYGLFDFRESESFETKLNSKIRLGGSFEASKNFRIGVDTTIPLKEEALDREKGFFSLGTAINVIPNFLGIDGGITSSRQYGTRVPVGISLDLFKTAQISVSTSDLVTLLSNDTDPLSNISVGTLRIKLK